MRHTGFRHSIATDAGMTLVEILIVVVILGIAAMVVTPLFGESASTRLGAAARLLVADLQFAQLESIAHADDPYCLKFDIATSSYSIVKRSGAPPFDCNAVTTVTNPIGNEPFVTQYGTGRGSQLAGVTIDSFSLGGDACLVFGAYGQTDQATAATVTLRAGSNTLVLSIDPISGEATIP